ncbi:hypothetical protein Tco_0014531 [Tanacetum coccineum]
MLVDMLGVPVTDDTELGRRMIEFATRVRQDTDEIYVRLDEAQDDRLLMSGWLNKLFRDRRDHARTALLMEREARLSCEPWGQSMDASDTALPRLWYCVLREMAPKRTTRTTPATETATTTSVTNAQLQEMIEQGVTTALAARDANRSTEGVVKLTQWFERMETSFCISNCTVDNQVKFSTCTLLGVALTWWKSHVKTVGHDIAYAMTWTDLKKKMTDKYCPRGEIKKLEAEMFPEESDKVERYVGGLPDMIHGSIVASKPKTMQKAIEMATELMDKKISTLAKRQAENKRKFDDTSRNIQNQQRQENKRLRDVVVYYHFAMSTFPVKIVIRPSAFILEYLLQLPIREEMVVLMRNFNVIPNTEYYKFTNHPYKISFDRFSFARWSNTFNGDVNNSGFEVTKFCVIRSLNLDTDLPIDVTGEVISWEYKLREYEVYGSKVNVLPIKLKDAVGIEITCLVFHILGEKMLDYIISYEAKDKFLVNIENARVFDDGKGTYICIILNNVM